MYCHVLSSSAVHRYDYLVWRSNGTFICSCWLTFVSWCAYCPFVVGRFTHVLWKCLCNDSLTSRPAIVSSLTVFREQSRSMVGTHKSLCTHSNTTYLLSKHWNCPTHTDKRTSKWNEVHDHINPSEVHGVCSLLHSNSLGRNRWTPRSAICFVSRCS